MTLEENQLMTKNQFVWFVTNTVKELPFGIRLGYGCIPQHFAFAGGQSIVIVPANERATLGQVWEYVASGTARQAYLALHLPIEKDLAPIDGETLLDVVITTPIDQRHIFDQELLLKSLIHAAGWMAMHEIQEAAARKMNCDRLIPHGTNKLHVSPQWKRVRRN